MQFPQATDTFASSARPPDDSQEIEREYLQRVRDECRYLDSEGVDQRRAELSEVFVMLEAVPSRRRESVADVAPVPERAEEMGFFGQLAERIGLKEPSRQAASSPPPPPPPPVPLSQVLKEHQRLVILGEPGTGKTTLLQFVALCFASDRWAGVRLGLDETRLPVRIALKTYDGIERLDRFIVQQLDRAYVPIETGQVWLAEGRLAILLDGLDEVQEGQRASVLNALQLFAGTQEGKNSRIVLTSRIAGYSGTTDFGEYTIKPLTGLDDASSYVAGWLSALQGTPPGTAQTEAEVLLAKMQQESSLRLVLTNPLLLRLAVALFVDTGEVARNRAELYRRYVEEVAWQRAQGRENCRWGLTQVEAALEIVAWTLHVKGLHTDGSLARAIASAEPEIDNSSDLVAYLRESMGLLASYGYYQGELVGFRHLTFQEYFVARRLYRAWTQDQKRAWRFIRPRLHHPAWREPILMMAAMLDENEATSFVARVWRKAHSPYERELHRDHLLAVLIVADRTSVDQRIANELVQSLVRLLLDVQVRWIHLLLHLLPWIVFFLPPVLVILSDLLFPAMPHFEINVQVVVVLILVSIVLQKLMVPLRRSGQGRYQHLRQQIIAALKVLPTNQKALAWQVLINRAITDSDVEPLLTWKVASVLNDIREPEVALAFIQDLSNTNSQVRWRGAVALGELNDLQAVVPLIHA